ncbi:acetylornithine deacetylase [Elioraea tepidiphila]|jgi:acetylornithine deacetylase|uniref:acetylornithine deacetylase n=1 Tax=Elioraea tepidiphila TaxID=457934 RepID=UPI002FDA7A16
MTPVAIADPAPADARVRDTVALLDRLVSFDTTSRNSNLACIGFIKDYLARHGVESRLTHDPTGTKANLYATIGPQGVPGVALSGHVDVVPVDGQDWSSDPFRLRRAHGRLYGRGTSDMKGFVAACLAMVPAFQARGLRRPIHLCFTYDEEVGCHGARVLAADLAGLPVRPEMVIVGEPSSMKPILGHKGKVSATCRVIGLAGHSSRPDRAVNALHVGAEIVSFLNRQQARIIAEGPHDARFDPPWTSCHAGVFRSGSALNIVPHEAEIVFEYRHIPAHDARMLLDELRAHAETVLLPPMRAVHPGAAITFDERPRLAGMDLAEDHPLADLVRSLTGANEAGRVAYGTEGGIFQEAGMAAIVCGPGDIAQAHTPDEWIAESELAACAAFLARLADRLAA